MEACVNSQVPLNSSFRNRFWIRSIRSIFDLYANASDGQAIPISRLDLKRAGIIHFGFASYAVFLALYFFQGAEQKRSNRSVFLSFAGSFGS